MAGLLAQEGISTRVFNENAQGAMGEIPFTQAYPEVWVVEDAQFTRARGILNEFESSAPTATLTVCDRCGEQNPGNFELCWQCGEALS